MQTLNSTSQKLFSVSHGTPDWSKLPELMYLMKSMVNTVYPVSRGQSPGGSVLVVVLPAVVVVGVVVVVDEVDTVVVSQRPHKFGQ